MKLEETENLKLQYVTTIQTISPKMVNTQCLDPKLAEKNSNTLKYTKRTQHLKIKGQLFKIGEMFVEDKEKT